MTLIRAALVLALLVYTALVVRSNSARDVAFDRIAAAMADAPGVEALEPGDENAFQERFGVSPKRMASLLDTFSCVVQGLIPYGAQLLMASGLAGLSALDIIPRLYYPFALCVSALLAILILPSGRLSK